VGSLQEQPKTASNLKRKAPKASIRLIHIDLLLAAMIIIYGCAVHDFEAGEQAALPSAGQRAARIEHLIPTALCASRVPATQLFERPQGGRSIASPFGEDRPLSGHKSNRMKEYQ
jgi:hypothetical protein